MKKNFPITAFCNHCGSAFTTFEYKIKAGRGKYCSVSCSASVNSVKHGGSKSSAYTSWALMIQRCRNPKHPKYYAYGAVGIKVSPVWEGSFAAFYADMGDRPKGTTLDRINGKGNYEPGNCRWATIGTQQRNRKNNVVYTLNGKTQCLQDWAQDCGVTWSTLSFRIRAGWPLEKALTSPRNSYKLPLHNVDSA